MLTHSKVDISCSVGIAADNVTIVFVTDAQTGGWVNGIARMTFCEVKLMHFNQSL